MMAMAHHLGKPLWPAWTRGVGLQLGSAAWCQATVEELAANRCGMNMAGLITQIKVGSGGLRVRAAAVSRRHCWTWADETLFRGRGAPRAHFGRFLELLSLV